MDTTHADDLLDATATLLAPILHRMGAALDAGSFVDMDTELATICPPTPTGHLHSLIDEAALRQGVGTEVWERLGFVDRFFLRHQVVEAYGFALPGPGTAFPDAVRPFGPVVEIAAGLGTLGRLLRAAGVDCVSTDAQPWQGARDVEAMDGATALARFPGRTVLCAWPDYGSTWLTHLLGRFAPGQHLLLVGEGMGGCTGDDTLFDTLASWHPIPVARGAIWSWEGIHDRLTCWRAP